MAEESMRLQKYLARSGVASRRTSESLILEGRVTVNGLVITELGCSVRCGVDEVCFDGKAVFPIKEKVVFILNKPAGVTTTMADPYAKRCVRELLPMNAHPDLFCVGRLDRETTGLLLVTNDGELGYMLTHPSHHVAKTYEVCVAGAISDKDMARLECGIELEDGLTAPAQLELIMRNKDQSQLQITIHEGKKRQIRRMFNAVGHPVLALHRASVGPVTLGNLAQGAVRQLNQVEIESLRAVCLKDFPK